MSWWKNLLKVGAAVAPFALAPFTGGSSLALTLLGSGAGAAEGALGGGGVKGTLLGAGLGAAGGYGMGALGSAGTGAAAGVRGVERGITGGNVAGFGSGILGQMFGGPQAGAATINAATNLVGGYMQARAQGKATDAEMRAASEALDFLKSQYATAQGQFKPYLDAGTAAVGRMNTMAANAPNPMSLLSSHTPAAPIQMRAPTGEMKMVDPAEVAHYQSLGGQVMA